MKKTAILIYLLFSAAAVFAQQNLPTAPNLTVQDKNPNKILPVTVEYPHQNTRIAQGAKGIFLFGKVHSGGGLLTINGVDVPIYRTGTWLTYLPVTPGDMDFIIEFTDAEKTHKYIRSVFVRGFDYRKYLDKPGFDTSSLFPASDVELSSSDVLDFTVAGTPDMVVKMSAGDYFKDALLIASQREPGIYKKTVNFNNAEPSGKASKVTYYMYDDNGKLKAKASSLGRIKILPENKASKTAKVIREDSRLRPAPQPNGHILDTKLFGNVEITGKINNLYRVKLDDNIIGWIERRFLNPAADLKKPKNIAWEISAAPQEGKTVLTIKNTEKVSFKVEETHDSFNIVLYYTQALNTIMSDSEDELISGLDYEILSDGAKKIKANYKNGAKLWGYTYRYDDNNLIFELYHQPKFNFTEEKPLNGLKVVLDPGHSPKRTIPYDGAVGPSGLLEYEANYAIALSAKSHLESLGAEVFLSKEENENMPLGRRTEKIDQNGAHLFISVHNNALPDFIDPFARERGSSVFYYYPHSLPFAQAMQSSFIKNVGLPTEGIIQADFSVTRSSPQVPSILIENVYMMIPYQEELLKQERFINILGSTIAEGVINFVNPTWNIKERGSIVNMPQN